MALALVLAYVATGPRTEQSHALVAGSADSGRILSGQTVSAFWNSVRRCVVPSAAAWVRR